MKAKKYIAIAILVVMATLAFFAMFFQIQAEAKTGMYSRDAEGNVYISETGWVRIGNDTYYSHSTKSRMYAKHEVCRNAYRWKGTKLYYFKDDGKMLRRSTKYIKLNKDHSVRYIYTPGTNHCQRWNARLLRYQERNKRGRWVETGNQTNMWWACDWQASIRTGDRCA